MTDPLPSPDSDDEFVFPSDRKPNRGDDLTCEVCGKELTYSGRGRKPKRCDEHKPNRTTSTGTRNSPRRTAAVERIRTKSSEQIATLGLMVSFVNEFDGKVVINKAPSWGDAFAALADSSPRARRVLESVFADVAYLQIVSVGLSTILPIMWYHGAFGDPNTNEWLAKVMVQMAGFDVPADSKPVFTVVPDEPADTGHVESL